MVADTHDSTNGTPSIAYPSRPAYVSDRTVAYGSGPDTFVIEQLARDNLEHLAACAEREYRQGMKLLSSDPQASAEVTIARLTMALERFKVREAQIYRTYIDY